MPRKPKETQAKRHADEARSNMQNLGIYKPEFEPVIAIYGELCEQYEELTKRFVKSGYKYEVSTAQGTKKAPIVTTLESLRKDILSYAGQLGMTPQGLLKADENAFKAKKKTNALTEALKAAAK